jgi:hypothetical protein
MDEPGVGTAVYTVSVCATATVTGGFDSVNALERAMGEATRTAGRQLYVQAFAALQDDWLAQRRERFPAQRWRTLHWLTPFGAVALPVRLVREKASGRYFTLSKILFRTKAPRQLSPALEPQACAAATEQNYRPAARSLSRWIGARVGPWLVWAGVQFHGARRLLELEKTPPPPAQPMHVPALISEIDSTWLKAQQRHRSGPVRHFPVHLGLHYTGPDAHEFRRLLRPVWDADSEAALQALKQSPLRTQRPQAFRELFGYLLGNRKGIDAWLQIPARLRPGRGRAAAPVKCGSGAVEKNIEVEINRRVKRQGRS